jgi:hypothetical protein
VRVPGYRAYSLTEILSNLTFFRSFILVVIKLLAALGLHAEELMTLVDLATSLEKALPPPSILRVLSTVLPPSLNESLEHFGSSIKAWIFSFSSVPVGHLVLEASRVQAALVAINKDRKRDLSQFGLPSSSVFPSVISAAPRQISLMQPLTSALKRKAQDYRSAESHPGHFSSDRRAKASSSSLPSARKTSVIDPADQLATRSPRQVK